MFRVEMLPAGHGDCLWIEYGTVEKCHRILVDGGLAITYPYLRNRILALPKAERVFELLIVTHVDNDHIEGLIPLLQDSDLGCRFNDVWYNGWRHLEGLADAASPDDVLGAREGEFLGVLLEDQALPWNLAFGGERIEVPDDGALPSCDIAGMKLTVLSPSRLRLTRLKARWRKAAAEARFTAGDTDSIRVQLHQRRYLPQPAGLLGVEDRPPGGDNAEANGSSIAVLAEYGGTKALLTGDAWPDVLQAGLEALGATPDQPMRMDLWKLAHHGSWQNYSENLHRLIKTPRYLVSTNGRAPFNHPHAKTLQSIIKQHRARGKPELIFNYRTPTTERWVDPRHPEASDFVATYPSGAVLLL